MPWWCVTLIYIKLYYSHDKMKQLTLKELNTNLGILNTKCLKTRSNNLGENSLKHFCKEFTLVEVNNKNLYFKIKSKTKCF